MVRQEQEQSTRLTSLSNRAATLVSAAAIATSLLSQGPGDPWRAVAIFCSLTAAIAGCIALVPVRTKVLDIDVAWAEIRSRDEEAAFFYLADRAAAIIKSRKFGSTRRARTVQIGFILLAGSIVATAAMVASSEFV